MGLAITQMMSISEIIQWGMRQSAEVTNQMMSVERILEYTQLAPEENPDEPLRIEGHINNWPTRGSIEFKSVFMSYEGKEHVLKDLSFRIEPTEKVTLHLKFFDE